MIPETAARLKRLPHYYFAVTGQRILELRSQGHDVINLDVGSPDMPPPEAVISALASSASRADSHGYSGYRGIPEFRHAVARYYESRFGVHLDSDREILPLLGSKEGIVNLSLAFLDHGDISLVPDISYPAYAMGARLAGADVFWLSTRPETGFLPDLTSIPSDALQRAKLLWVNYPNNPTGVAVDVDHYHELIQFCREHQLLLASDNPYVDVTYDGYRAPSALQVPDSRDHVVEFMSFSKTFNMGGWRLGAAVGSSDALSALLQIKSNIDSGHFRAIYEAGIAAIDMTLRDWIDERNHVYELRRDRILQALPTIGLSAMKPSGALYVWAACNHHLDGQTYAQEALDHAHVALAAGSAYGPGGTNHVRLSVAVPDHRLIEALERLQNWFGRQ